MSTAKITTELRKLRKLKTLKLKDQPDGRCWECSYGAISTHSGEVSCGLAIVRVTNTICMQKIQTLFASMDPAPRDDGEEWKDA